MVGEHRARHVSLGRALVAGTVVALLAAPLAYADTLTVTTANDWGLGCLRQCVADANPGDEIVFDPAMDGQPIVLTGGHVVIDKDLTINGRGPDKTILDGNALSSVLFVAPGTTARVANLTVENGAGMWHWYWYGYAGGGIRVAGGTDLDLVNLELSGNAADLGGAMFVDPGAVVSLTDVVIRDNSTTLYAGGIWNQRSRLEIVRGTIRDNSAGYYGGAILSYDGAQLTLTDSTISGNSTAGSYGYGGGIWNAFYSSLSLVNSTVSGNSAGYYGGGIFTDYYGPVTLAQVTLTDNWAPYGGGMFSYRSPVTLSNSIVANQAAGSDCYSWTSSFSSLGHNLDSDGSCNLTQPTDRPRTEPMLRPLADHPALRPGTLDRRTARVHLLMPGSPAIDAGSFGAVPYDQRGLPRNLDGDRNGLSAWDIGAVEFVPYRLRVRGPDGEWIVIAPDPF